MDLRNLPEGLSAEQRLQERKKRVETELGIDLSLLEPRPEILGNADEKNCEQMIGVVPIPVGIAGPLTLTVSSGQEIETYLPLATTEGALVASVNRGCKAISMSGGAMTKSVHHGTSRSIALKIQDARRKTQSTHSESAHTWARSDDIQEQLQTRAPDWVAVAEATSHHLKVLNFEIDILEDHLFLNIFCDTDEAMGMNMVTIAAQAVGEWMEKNIEGLQFVTVAANVDSDKKPSIRTHQEGRGFEVTAEATIPSSVITEVLKTTPEALLEVAKAKLELGSKLAGAIGHNLHAANVIAAMYLATGQDAAHVVEGSMTDTNVEYGMSNMELRMSVRIPSLMLGIRGGGTDLPAQSQALALALTPKTSLHPRAQLAETIGAAVLAGELSLLAAQANHELAKAHKKLGRT